MTEKKAARFSELDGLRGIAAATVVLLHLSTEFHDNFSPQQVSLMAFPLGHYGVHLFFLISGFVILMTAEKTNNISEFAFSRFSRLFPAYWVAIAVTVVVYFVLPVPGGLDTRHIVMRAIANLIMVENWFNIGTLDGVYWTLQVEMLFYIVLAILIRLHSVDKALPVMTSIVIWSLVDHLVIPRDVWPFYQAIRRLAFIDVAFLFTLGILIYRLQRQTFNRRHALVVFLCLASPATANYFPNNPISDTGISALLAVILYLASKEKIKALAWKPLLFLGAISYSLYLIHHSLGQALLYYADRRGLDANAALAAVLVICTVLAYLMRVFVELPGLRWLRALRTSGREFSASS